MVNRCQPVENLAEILTLPSDDERRRHLEECPRCRTLARRFRDFLSPAPLPPEADAEAASRALRERLTTALPELVPALESEDQRQEQPVTAHTRQWGWRPSRKSMRPLMAVAAVLVCCVGLLTVRHQLMEPGANGNLEHGSDVPVLRGENLAPASLVVADMAQGFKLSWGQPTDTDAAELVLIDANLGEIARLDIGTSGTFDLARPPADARYARVEFLLAGDVVSSTRTIPLAAAR